MFEALRAQVDVWVPIDIPVARALPAETLAAELVSLQGARVIPAGQPAAAIAAAVASAGAQGRVVVFGSFMTVQAVMECFEPAMPQAAPA
jgi:dihydrofolate synthase / folylpolyglutamate synthase